MSILKKLIARTSAAAAVRLSAPKLAVAATAAAARARLLSSTAFAAKSSALKASPFGSQPSKALATAAAPPPPPPPAQAPAEQAMFDPKWMYRGWVFPQLRGMFGDYAEFEKRNGVVWQRWGPFPDIDICWVYNNTSGFSALQAGLPHGNAGPSCALMRFKPHARVPPHWHTGAEHILYLNGSQTDERGTWRAGDMVVNPAGTDHWDAVTGPDGCVVLTIWERTALPLNPAAPPKPTK